MWQIRNSVTPGNQEWLLVFEGSSIGKVINTLSKGLSQDVFLNYKIWLK